MTIVPLLQCTARLGMPMSLPPSVVKPFVLTEFIHAISSGLAKNPANERAILLVVSFKTTLSKQLVQTAPVEINVRTTKEIVE